MVQVTNMQTNLQGKEQFSLEKVAKKIWVVLTTTSNLYWIKYFLSIGASALTVLVMIFDFAFFRQVAKDYLPFKDDTVLWFIAAFCCVFIVVLLKLVFSAIIELWIEQRNDYQGIKSYSLRFWGLGMLLLGLLVFALYASNNGVLVTAKNNIVFAKLPENTDLQAAKDSLAASQRYYNNMIAKEQGELAEAKANLEKDRWNPSYNALVKGAAKQKEILISAKLEQAKYWQNRINKIENRFYEEVQQVKAANKLLETETVSNTKAVSMYAYAALFFLSLVSVFIFYDGNNGNPSPTFERGQNAKNGQTDNGQADKTDNYGQVRTNGQDANKTDNAHYQELVEFVSMNEEKYNGITSAVERFLYPKTEQQKRVTQQDIANDVGISKQRLSEKMKKYREYFAYTKPIDFDKESALWEKNGVFSRVPINGSNEQGT